jgi:hypothetical protein
VLIILCILLLIGALALSFWIDPTQATHANDPRDGGGTTSTQPRTSTTASVPGLHEIICYDPNGWYPIHTDISRFDPTLCRIP